MAFLKSWLVVPSKSILFHFLASLKKGRVATIQKMSDAAAEGWKCRKKSNRRSGKFATTFFCVCWSCASKYYSCYDPKSFLMKNA